MGRIDDLMIKHGVGSRPTYEEWHELCRAYDLLKTDLCIAVECLGTINRKIKFGCDGLDKTKMLLWLEHIKQDVTSTLESIKNNVQHRTVQYATCPQCNVHVPHYGDFDCLSCPGGHNFKLSESQHHARTKEGE